VGNGHREPVNARARKTAAATSAGSSRLRAGSGGGTGQVSLDTADVVRDVLGITVPCDRNRPLEMARPATRMEMARPASRTSPRLGSVIVGALSS
jgi:hypothetical protein